MRSGRRLWLAVRMVSWPTTSQSLLAGSSKSKSHAWSPRVPLSLRTESSIPRLSQR